MLYKLCYVKSRLPASGGKRLSRTQVQPATLCKTSETKFCITFACMRCFAPFQAVITFSLADLFSELRALDYRHSKVQNMGRVKMTFHKFIKSHFYGTVYKMLSDVNFLSRCSLHHILIYPSFLFTIIL